MTTVRKRTVAGPRPVARGSVALLAMLALCSCAPTASPSAQVSPPPSSAEAGSSVSRVRVVNDSATNLTDLELLFPQEQVAVGDVAAGATSAYVPVAEGVYGYSAFRHTVDAKQVVQPVIDFVGESPLPTGDYTYVLEVHPDSDHPIELQSVTPATH